LCSWHYDAGPDRGTGSDYVNRSRQSTANGPADFAAAAVITMTGVNDLMVID